MVAKRPVLLAGNWKMYHGPEAARDFLCRLGEAVQSTPLIGAALARHSLSLAFFPPAVSLHVFQENRDTLPFLKYGTQNVHWEKEGAFTGEISVPMLREMSCHYSIIGHSERRHLFGENDFIVERKVRACISGGITPVLCVGETLEEREKGHTADIVERQFIAALENVSPEEAKTSLVVAYEPVWAIGTGKTARDEDAQEVCCHIRRLAVLRFGEETAAALPVLYGGSVKPGNIRGLLEQADIDGALVGGASLHVESCLELIKGALETLA